MVVSMSTSGVTPASHMAPAGEIESDCSLQRPRYELVTLGAAALIGANGQLVLDRSKPLALLTYLHAAPNRSATRSYLCDLLWSNSSPERAANALRTTLYRLRDAVEGAVPECPTGEVTLGAPIASDYQNFIKAVAAGDLERILASYAGPFFPEYSDSGTAQFEQWAEHERARLQEYFVHAAGILVERALAEGRSKEAVKVARRVRLLAPEAEVGWRLLLESLIAAHDDLAAHAEAEALQCLLKNLERDAEPSTARLLEIVHQGGAAPESAPQVHEFVTDLIGREREFSTIIEAWSRAAQGTASHIHLMAPAGFGKTRLLDESASRLKTLGARIVRLRATSGEREVEYALAATLARELALLPGATGISPEYLRTLIALQPSLGASYPGVVPAGPTQELVLHRANALGEVLAAVAEERPTALLIDDLHWCDAESHRVLLAVVSRLDKQRVLVLTAARPARYGLPGEATVLTLTRFSVAQTEALLASAGAAPSAEWRGRLAAALNRASGGSPLLILDTLRLARDQNDLELEGGHWLSKDFEGLLHRVENAGGLETRLAGLNHQSRQLLLLLAVAGTPLSMASLTQMAGKSSEAISSVLQDLERRGYVMLAGEDWDIAYENVASVVISGASPEGTRAAHLAIGHWLLSLDADDRVTLTRAARHLALGGAKEELESVLCRWITGLRSEGDWTPIARLATTLLGTAAEKGEISSLSKRIPIRLRLRHLPLISASLVVSLVLAGVALAFGRLTPTVDAPGANLLVATKGKEGSRVLWRIPVSRARWNTTDTIRLTEGEQVGQWDNAPPLFGRVAVSPDGRRIIYDQVTTDSGVFDLFLREANGSIHRITDSPGDDVHPNWSPDGRYVAFATARWTPRGDEDSDLGILELASGKVRQLTSGLDRDVFPIWSPDGTRIAFYRQRAQDGARQLCWTTFDGMVHRCIEDVVEPEGIIGWATPDQVLVQVDSRLLSVVLSTSAVHTIDSLEGPGHWDRLSADGEWLLLWRGVGGSTRTVTEVVRLDDTRIRRSFYESEPLEPVLDWLPGKGQPEFIASLRIWTPRDAIVGVPNYLFVEAVSTLGASARFAGEALTWHSGDSTLVVVDRRTGVAIPRRIGETWIKVSAGGWREDSVRFRISAPQHRQLFREQWNDPTLAQWRLFGDPRPHVVETTSGPAFHSNGDNTFESGAVTLQGFSSDKGVGVETTMIVPVQRPKWQDLKLGLGELSRVAAQGGVTILGCHFAFPAGEGVDMIGTMSLTLNVGGVNVTAPPSLNDGRWHRLRMQVFPDRTCGIALDGRPVWRSAAPLARLGPFRLAISGHSVGTRVLVGPVDIWEGVKTDLDWRVLESKQNRGNAIR